MGFIDRLKRFFGFGGEESASETADERPDERTEATRECSVCGTTVDAGADECPLCHSSDLVVPDTEDDSGDESPDEANEMGLDPDSATTKSTADGSETAAASERLAELRQEQNEE